MICRDDFWKAVPRLKYGQERFGSGNLYLSSINSNTKQHVHVQHTNFCEHANNAQRSNQHHFLLWIFAGNLIEQTTSQRQVGSNFRYEVDDAFDLSAPQASHFLWLSRSRSVWGYRSQVVLKLGKQRPSFSPLLI